jgi:predicted O-methyltransferase YrrM
MPNLHEFLKEQNVNFQEMQGFSQETPRQIEILKDLVSKHDIKTILEIGFNAGHSSELFLETNKTTKVVSFDLGGFNHVTVGKSFVDKYYPFRHSLILGDSTVTVPEFANSNEGVTFDLIFIDGGHQYPISKADLVNCKKMAHKDTLVIMDDTVYADYWKESYTIGPTTAWIEGLQEGLIVEVGKEDMSHGRGMSWGKYL